MLNRSKSYDHDEKDAVIHKPTTQYPKIISIF